MSSREAMLALLQGYTIDTPNAGRIRLDKEGQLIRIDVKGYSVFLPFGMMPEIEEPKELKLGPEHVGRRVRLRRGAVTIITAYIQELRFKIVTPLDDHLVNGKTEEDPTSEDVNDIMEILND